MVSQNVYKSPKVLAADSVFEYYGFGKGIFKDNLTKQIPGIHTWKNFYPLKH